MDCAQYDGGLREAWLAGDFMEAVVCPYNLQMGELTFGLMIYGAVCLGLYVRTGSAVVPAVVTIVGGTVAVSQIPSRGIQIMVITLMLVFTAAGYFVYRQIQR